MPVLVPPAARGAQKSKLLDVYTVTESSSGTSSWTRVGSASVGRDGTLRLKFDLPPSDGELRVCAPRPPRAQA